jgi:hypothetical protein
MTPTNMDAKQVLGLIEAAFPLRPLPEMSLHQAHLADDSMTRKISDKEWQAAATIDADRTWQDYSDQELLSCDAALAHFDETSFVYYIPAFLDFAVRHCDETLTSPVGSFVGSAVFSVTHRTPYSLGRFKRLSIDQRNAVIAFLEFVVAHGQHGDETDAQKALSRYWKADEASKPLLIVP